MAKLTLKALKQTYTQSKRENDAVHMGFISYNILRPISFPLTIPFLKLGFSPNQVTFLGLITGMSGVLSLATGTYDWMLIGAILINFAALLDMVDGNIARYHKSGSYYGDFMDGVVGNTFQGLIPFALGIGISKFESNHLNISSENVIILGGVVTVIYYLPVYIAWRFRAQSLMVKLENIEDPEKNSKLSTSLTSNEESISKDRMKKFARAVISRTKKIRGDIFMPILFLIYFGWASIILATYLLIFSFEAFLSITFTFFRARIFLR